MLGHAGDDQGPRLSIEVDARSSQRAACDPDARRRQLRRHARGDRIHEPVETRSEAAPTGGDRPCDAVDLVPSKANGTPPIRAHARPHARTMPRRVSARKQS